MKSAKFIPVKTFFTTAQATFAISTVVYGADAPAWIGYYEEFALIDHYSRIFVVAMHNRLPAK